MVCFWGVELFLRMMEEVDIRKSLLFCLLEIRFFIADISIVIDREELVLICPR